MHQLNRESVIAAWGLYLLMPLVFLFRKRSVIGVRAEVKRLMRKFKQVPLWMLGVIFLVGVIAGVMAVASPPMNFDVQSYHLPRQVFWLMQGSVDHFDATYPYQNSHPVLTEYLGLNLMLLSGGDAWHNLVQWFFFVAACGLITLINRSIGGNAKAQALAVLFVALVPVAFFQASNSKNDITASFYILAPLLIGIRIWMGESKVKIPLLLLAALGAGLAMATKGTAAAYLPAVALLLLIGSLRMGAWKSVIMAALPGVMIVAMAMAPNAIRNFHSYGSITGASLGMANDAHAPLSVLGVAIKNIANQYAFGSEEAIERVEAVAQKVLLDLGLNPDDPLTNIGAAQLGGSKLHFLYFPGCEDVIPAPIQTTLCLMIPLFFLIPRFRGKPGTNALGGVVLVSFLLFCAIFRWQPWGGRLLIPEFFVAAPLIGLAETLLLPAWGVLVITALEILFLQPHMLSNGTRHLEGGRSVFALSKESQMSIALPGREEEIRSLLQVLRSSGASISVVKVDGHDSPIYGLLRQMRLEFPNVKIRSGHAGLSSGEDAVVEAVGSLSDLSTAPQGYQTLWAGKFYRLSLRKP